MKTTKQRAPRKPRQAIKGDPRYQAFTRALGHQIAQVRRERGNALKLTQGQIAKAAEIDVSRLSQIEHGQAMASTWTLYGLGRALQVQPGAAFLDPVIQYLHDATYQTPSVGTGGNGERPSASGAIEPADVQSVVSDALYTALTELFDTISTSRLARSAQIARGQATKSGDGQTGRSANSRNAR